MCNKLRSEEEFATLFLAGWQKPLMKRAIMKPDAELSLTIKNDKKKWELCNILGFV